MLGVPGASESARESICVIDARTGGRLRAAGRHHLRATGQTRSVVATWALVLGGAPVLWRVLQEGVTANALLLGLFMLPVGVVLAMALVAFSVDRNLRAFVRREFQPGRMIGLTVGSHSLRIRDHNSSYEFTYDVIRRVEEHRDVVVVSCGDRFFLLPLELFDPVTLSVLRERAGRRSGMGRPAA